MKNSRPPLLPAAVEPGGVVDEATWMAVIGNMDEVYSRLIADEVALEEKNAALEQSRQFILGLLSSMSDVPVACDQLGTVEQTNAALALWWARAKRPCWASRWRAVGRRGFAPAPGPGAPGPARTAGDGDAQGRPARPGRRTRAGGIQRLGARGRQRPPHRPCLRRPAAGRAQARPAAALHSEKLASLGRLVAGAAHELNNPTSFLLGNVDALRKYAVLADLPSLIEGMSEGAQRTADIVSALKRFSAVDREDRAPVDMAAVVERAMHWMKRGATPGFRVEWQAPAEPCVTPCSAGQLLQVLMNLIQNAADACASRPDGRLHIVLERVPGAGPLRLRCSDIGPGLAPEHLSRAFDPFFTTKPVCKGTGLGLSISYGIVEQLGGRMSVASPVGGSAEFVAELPLAPG